MTVALDFDSLISRGSPAGVPAALRQRGRAAVDPHGDPSCLVITGDSPLRRRPTAAKELAGLEVDPVPVAALRQRGRAAVDPHGDPSCLVITGDASLQRRLTAAAELAGWEVDPFPVDAVAPGTFTPVGCQLLVVDVASPPRWGDGVIDSFVREFSRRSGSLLIVCGAAGSVEHESWARSMGAFVHVPGVADGDSLLGWFTEARAVSERRSQFTLVRRSGGSPSVPVPCPAPRRSS